MELLFVAIITVVAISIISSQSSKSKTKQNKNSLILNQNNILSYLRSNEIENEKKFISNDFSNAIILDSKMNELILITKKFTKKDGTFEHNFKKFKTNSILQSEIVIDNQTIIKTERTSQLLGAAVGGMVLGGTGILLGGLTGKKLHQDSVKSIQLKLLIDDVNSPTHKISFLTNIDQYTGAVMKNGYSKDSSEARNAITNIERWHGIMEVLIKQQNSMVSS